jgi:uncharacterized membrane protein YGL010W
MSQVAERKRPDPYADENMIVRRKRGVTIGAYQGLTIASLFCLVGALFFLGVDSAAQRMVSVIALAIAAVFLVTMARRKGVLMTTLGALTMSSMYGRDWASRKGQTR